MIGKIQPPTLTKVNQIAPKDRVSRWGLVSGVTGPFGNAKPNEFGFWFNYFWEEVVTLHSITPIQQQKAAEMFFSVFQGDQAPFTVQPSFARRDDSFKENILRQLLLIGFKRVALDTPKLTLGKTAAPYPGAPPRLTATSISPQDDAKDMNLYHVLGLTGNKVQIAFRADGRSMGELEQHKGFRTRARSGDSPIWKIYGFDKAWHPFNNPVYSNSLFLRLGSKNADNCLQTVISVGAEFAGITHFPILNDYALVFQAKSADGRYLSLKPLDEWTSADEQVARGHTQKVRTVRGQSGTIDHLEKDNYIYAFHLDDVKIFNTEAYFTKRGDAPFPERGAEQIPLKNFLCEIPFVQKWFFSWDDGQIMLYELEFKPINWYPSQEKVDLLIGEKARQQLEVRIKSEITKAVNRDDIKPDKRKYTSFQTDTRLKAKLLNAKDRQDLYKVLNTYRGAAGTGAAPTIQEQKIAVEKMLRAAGGSKTLSESIPKIDSNTWAMLVREAGTLTAGKRG